MSDILDTFPMPEDAAEKARIEEGFRRARMMDGEWRQDADEYYAGFFHPDVRDFLPPANIAINILLSLSVQMATALDEDPAVKLDEDLAAGSPALANEDLLDAILTEECWPLMVEALPRLCAMHEQVVYVTFTEGRGITYETIDPQYFQEVRADPVNPDQMASCIRIRRRTRPGTRKEEWTRETWDPTLTPPLFRIDARRGGADTWEDVTAEYVPGWTGDYPRRASDGRPLFPFVTYHDRMGSRLWRTRAGSEVVCGTLDASALNTMWMMGMRDGAHPQRVAIDLDTEGARNTSPNGGQSQGYIVAMPGTALQLRSSPNKNGSITQWSPTLVPKDYREAIDIFTQSLAIYAGVSPADLQVTTGQSGYAITLSRDGQRKSQRRIEPSLRRADRLRFALAAAMHNAATGTQDLPEDPRAYEIEYRGLPPTHEEVLAEQKEAEGQRKLGVLSPVEHYQKIHPEATDEEAWEALVKAAEQEAALMKIRSPIQPAAPGGDAASADQMPPPDKADPIQPAEKPTQPATNDQGETT